MLERRQARLAYVASVNGPLARRCRSRILISYVTESFIFAALHTAHCTLHAVCGQKTPSHQSCERQDEQTVGRVRCRRSLRTRAKATLGHMVWSWSGSGLLRAREEPSREQEIGVTARRKQRKLLLVSHPISNRWLTTACCSLDKHAESTLRRCRGGRGSDPASACWLPRATTHAMSPMQMR